MCVFACAYAYVYTYIYICAYAYVYTYIYIWTHIKPIADREAQNLEIISKNLNLVPGVPGFLWDISLVPFLM